MLRNTNRAEIKADIFASAIISMRRLFPRAKAFRAQFIVWDSKRTYTTAPNSTVIRVPTELLLIRAEFTRERECPTYGRSKRITIQNLEVVRVNADENLILVRSSSLVQRNAL